MNRDRPKVRVGQMLFMAVHSTHRANQDDIETKDVEVVKVGRKYFYTDHSIYTQHYIHNWKERTQYSQSTTLYDCEKEYIDQKRSMKLRHKLRELFSSMWNHNQVNLTLDQLERINMIIQEKH